MSRATYTNARMNRGITPKSSAPRYALKAPDREVAFRLEHLATERTTLLLKPHGDPQSDHAYKISDKEGSPAFTATGRKYNGRSCRELRDSSGLPLFDIHTKPFSNPLGWVVTLPGSKISDATIAKATPKLTWNSINLVFSFRNGAAEDRKSEEDKQFTLTVKKHGEALAFFDVVDGDRRIAELRESITHNKRLTLRKMNRGVGHRPALDLIVSPGVDISLVTVIAVIVSDWFFGSG
ncbi:hypothetical protein E8E15_006332 [Penicillium rubens]|uniref:uncharacterized protein n=1 Tax=Penicillium rubens TaxID=1108849 RepID=UPI001E101F72|nr:uncharacterized protein N7525_001503 [Penicillium rubens]KAF3025262.1 hypothetical protein E8E15_006332 [Penicillium rubens]KAJ5034514.1 hypothetical protein NUH16_005953 [Penicillium rubens]KAJ5843762.1 hypothetical protein N7525_001503 [Penicillium rubens]